MFFGEANFNIVDCEGDIFIGRPVRWNVLKKIEVDVDQHKEVSRLYKKKQRYVDHHNECVIKQQIL